MTRAEEARWK